MNELIQSLRKIFGDCKRPATSECLKRSSYELTNLRTFYIYDYREHEQPVRIVLKRDNHQLTVNNRNITENDVYLIKTDKCLFTNQHKKCDCILVNKNKIFFVEISESGKRSNKRREAVEQLGYTIQILKDNNIDFSFFESKAIICFKSGEIKPTQPSLNTKRAIFQDQHKTSLEEGNEIWF